MTKTQAIIWRRIEEKAERMASQETLHSFTERELKCWDAHCYKYVNAYGKVNYILSQEEFNKIKWILGLKEHAYELMNNQKRRLSAEQKAIFHFVLSKDMPDLEVLQNLFCIPPMWDDREKST